MNPICKRVNKCHTCTDFFQWPKSFHCSLYGENLFSFKEWTDRLYLSTSKKRIGENRVDKSYTLYLQLLQCNLQHTNFAVFSYKQFSTILVLYTNQTFEYCMMLSTYMFVKKKIGSIRINKSCYF